MFSFLSLLSNTTVAPWISEWFPRFRIGLAIVLAIFAIAMIILVLIQETGSGAMGGSILSGKRESFYSKNKGSSKEGRIKRAMLIIGIGFVIITILYFLSFVVYAG